MRLTEAGRETLMIQVSVEVRDGSGTARFSGEVRAESIERAVQVTNARYPGSEVRVVFPIEPEAFFGEDVAPVGEMVRDASERGRLVERPRSLPPRRC